VSIDTRSREIRHKTKQEKSEEILVIRAYQSSVGIEFFIAYEDTLWYLLWFTRLLIPDTNKTLEREGLWKHTALIRELHVYGQLQSLSIDDKKQNTAVQHTGIGSRLMSHAQEISNKLGFKKLSVISGVGVREYYKKLGYHLEWTYMTKELK
jgi:elongator complex protein 3